MVLWQLRVLHLHWRHICCWLQRKHLTVEGGKLKRCLQVPAFPAHSCVVLDAVLLRYAHSPACSHGTVGGQMALGAKISVFRELQQETRQHRNIHSGRALPQPACRNAFRHLKESEVQSA